MKTTVNLLLALVIAFSSSCSDDDTPQSNCEFETVINNTQYTNANSADLRINNLSIEGDCLLVEYSASGCSGESWELSIIDSGNIAESSPEQRFLRFSFVNPEACLAFFTKQASFDLSTVQIGGNRIILNIEGGGVEETLTYDY